MKYRPATALIGLAPLLFVLCGAASDAPTGDVQLRVLGLDGKPAAQAKVELEAVERYPIPGSLLPHQSATTDDAGVAHVAWPVGAWRMSVGAKGIGYGWTGLFEVMAGQSVEPSLPPLAPFASISGTIPFDLADGDVRVNFSRNNAQPEIQASVEPDGHFSAQVRAGEWSIWAGKGDQRIAELEGNIQIASGQTLRDLKLSRAKAEADPGISIAPSAPAAGAEDKTIIWAQGTVRDESGQGVEGVGIYADILHVDPAGHPSVETIRNVTDAAGHYTVLGQANVFGLAPLHVLLVYKPGLLPRQVRISHAVSPPVAVRDVVLSARGGKLDVTALTTAGPMAGVAVGLYPENLMRDNTGWDPYRSMGKELQDILFPEGTTGSDGVAHFDSLPPGRYRVTALLPKPGWAPPVHTGLRSKVTGDIGAIAAAVPVRAGQTTTQRMLIYPQMNRAAMQVVRHDGQPMANDTADIEYGPVRANATAAIEYGPVRAGGYTQTVLPLDAAGVGEQVFTSPGLWRVAFKYRQTPVKSSPITEPCFTAEGFVAVSPWLEMPQPVKLTALRRDGGSVEVQLQDVAGKPARGIVEIDEQLGTPIMIGSTDGAGRIRFDRLPTGPYFIKACLLAQQDVDLGHFLQAPDGDDAALVGRVFIPAQEIDVQSYQLRRLTLSAMPAAYLRARLHAPTGHKPDDYTIALDAGDLERGANESYRPESGDFIAGPFLAGKVGLMIRRISEMNDRLYCGLQETNLTADRVTHLEMTIPPVAPPAGDPGNLRVQVLLDDGKTPAYGEKIYYDYPGHTRPVSFRRIEAVGIVFGPEMPIFDDPRSDLPPGTFAVPVCVALLPGSNGAALAEMVDPLKIVLPPPLSARGKVTIANASPSGKPGQLRVLAAYEGKGRLNTVLSVWATPQEDGTFELAGLTPGTYQVQAALDGIWLSQSVPLTVSDHALEAIHLDIAAPAGPVCVQLVDPQGQPLRGAAIQVDRPAGPLASLYWPSEFKTDGAGSAYIPALEAGKHLIRVVGTHLTQEVTPPALPAERPTVVRIQAPVPEN